MSALYDNPDISHREHWAPERAVAPKVRRKAAGANGVRFCGIGRKGRRPLRELRRGGRGEHSLGSRSGPPYALHSPEARAGSPSAAAPRGRWLQRRGRRRIMRPRSWPGRVDPDPLGSARLGPAGPVYRRQQPSRSGSPTPRPGQRNGTTPELDTARSRRSSCVLPAATPGASGKRFARTLAVSSATDLPKTSGFWSRDSTYGKTAEPRAPKKVARKRKAGAYGPPRGPRCVAIRATSRENASHGIIDLASGDSDPLSRLACARWRMENYRDGGRTHGSVSC